jgi:dipeptidase E
MASHLFAIGGGGYCGPQGGPNRMFLEVLRTTGRKYPKICLIPTAGGDKPETVNEFVAAMNRMCAHPDFLALYHIPTRDLEDWVMDFDAVYVSGGNTRNLLALWKEWNLDRILINAWKRGVVISGASAGANCWFAQSSSDFIPGEFNPIAGLGVLKGSCCPHYSEEKGRRESYLKMVQDGSLQPGYGISDRAALHYVEGELKEALVEWDMAGVYYVLRDASGAAVETKMPARTV